MIIRVVTVVCFYQDADGLQQLGALPPLPHWVLFKKNGADSHYNENEEK